MKRNLVIVEYIAVNEKKKSNYVLLLNRLHNFIKTRRIHIS